MDSFAPMSGKGIRHILSRLLVFYAALYTIDSSVDTDHLKVDCVKAALESYDDVDSFSEYLIEFITGNDKFVAEGDHDDQDTEHEMSDYVRELKLIAISHHYDLTPLCLPADKNVSFVRDTQFQYNDFSLLVAPPPKQATV